MFGSTIAAMGPLCLVTVSGGLLAHLGILNKSSNDTIAKASQKLLLPAFVFINIVKGVDFANIAEWWSLLVMPVLAIAIASVVGVVHTLAFNPPEHVKYTMNSLLIFANLGNVPVLLVEGACASYGPINGEPSCPDAASLIFLQVITFNVLAWSYGFGLVYLDYLKKEPTEGAPSFSLKKMILKQIFGPLPNAVYFGCVIGSIPGVKYLVTDSDAPLLAIYDALYTVGYAGIVLSQMILGSNIWLSRKLERTMSKRYIASVVFLRCVVITGLGVLIMWWFYDLGVFGDDIVMAYVSLMNFISPSTIFITLICQILDTGIQETATILFWMYLAAFISITFAGYTFFLLI